MPSPGTPCERKISLATRLRALISFAQPRGRNRPAPGKHSLSHGGDPAAEYSACSQPNQYSNHRRQPRRSAGSRRHAVGASSESWQPPRRTPDSAPRPQPGTAEADRLAENYPANSAPESAARPHASRLLPDVSVPGAPGDSSSGCNQERRAEVQPTDAL